MKEIFSFQKLKISFSKILLLKKPSHESLVLLFYLHNKEEVIYKNNKENHWFRSFIKRQTSGTSSDNQWQGMTTSGTTSDSEWHWMTTSGTTSDKEWQRMAMSDSEWEQCYSEWKWHNTLQRMDDCHHFNNKKRYTTTSRDGWLQLEWLNK